MDPTRQAQLTSLARQFAEILAEEIVDAVVGAVERKLVLPSATAPAAIQPVPQPAPRPGPKRAPVFLSLHEAAETLCRSERTIMRLIADGLLSRDPTSYRVLIPRTDVDHFIARRGAKKKAR